MIHAVQLSLDAVLHILRIRAAWLEGQRFRDLCLGAGQLSTRLGFVQRRHRRDGRLGLVKQRLEALFAITRAQ